MHDIPNFWRKRNFIAFLLYPLSLGYQVISGLLKLLKKNNHKPRIPIIVIGNITVGGNGKTPVVIALAKSLQQRGLTVGIISRGYRGQAKNPRLVNENASVNESGDEPLLIYQQTQRPVVICKKRNLAIKHLLKLFPETQIIISDDGLQHHQMSRSQEYVVIAPDLLMGNGFCLPAGPLRESLTKLKKVDGILYTGTPQNILPSTATYHLLKMDNDQFIRWHNQQKISDIECLNNANLICSIARPERFINRLQTLGIVIKEKRLFPDHYLFSESDALFSDNPQANILMTSKDAIKTAQWPQALREKIVVLDYQAILPDALIDDILHKENL